MPRFAAAAIGSLVLAGTVVLTAPGAYAGVTCETSEDGLSRTVTLTTKKGTTRTTYEGPCRGNE